MSSLGLEKSGVDPTAIRVAQLLRGEFLEARGVVRVQGEMTDDDIRRDLRGFGFHRVDGEGPTPLTVVLFYGTDWNATKLKPILPQLQSVTGGEIVLVMAQEGQKSGVVTKFREVQRAVRGRRVILVPFERFVMNPLKNIGVPPHRLLSAGEKATVMGDLRARNQNIPTMEGTEATAVWLGARPGDLVEIRRSSAAGTALAYRIVRDPLARAADAAPGPSGGAGSSDN